MLQRVPVQEIVFSFAEGLALLSKSPFSYDVVVTSFTPIYGPVRDYAPAQESISQILNAHPFAGIVLYSGADEHTLNKVATELGHRVQWVYKKDSSDTDLFRVRNEILIALCEYQLSIDESDHFRLVQGVSRSPISFSPKYSPDVVVKPHFESSRVLYPVELQEFEYLINKASTTEHEIHVFLEAHPKFLLGTRYKRLRSHIYLARDDEGAGPLVPDFILEPINASDFWKIVELKLPDDKITRIINDNQKGFSAKILHVLQQLRNYRDYFDNPKYRQRMQDIGIYAFKPEVSVIVGKDYGRFSIDEIIRARADFTGLEVITYAELLERARAMCWLRKD